MNWKQTIGLVLAIGAIIALCFIVIFPALYDEGGSKPGKIAKKSEAPSSDEAHPVLPKLKGVNWETRAQQEKVAEKKALKKDEKKAVAPEAEELVTSEEEMPAEEAEPKPLLELQEMTWYEQEGYAVVVGSVKNVSAKSLPSVQVHARFEGEDGWFIVAEHSLIDLNPIFPGQVSPFTVVARYYPEITTVILDFRKFSGETIPWSEAEIQDIEEGADMEDVGAEVGAEEEGLSGEAVHAP